MVVEGIRGCPGEKADRSAGSNTAIDWVSCEADSRGRGKVHRLALPASPGGQTPKAGCPGNGRSPIV